MQRYGQLSARASNCAYRDSFSICASLPNRPQITQICGDESKTEPRRRDGLVDNWSVARDESFTHHSITPAVLSASHVRAGAGVDFDGLAFLDKERNVDGFAGLEFCRFRH